MINLKIVFKITGILALIEAILLLSCAGISLIYQEEILNDFLKVAIGSAVLGGLLVLMGTRASKKLSKRDGYLVISLAWILFSAIGMLPYLISGYIPRPVDAFFESMSGFTTTGATILNNIESLPHGLLFWRSLTQWVGGFGFIFVVIAILPFFGIGSMQLFATETSGSASEKLHPRISATAKRIGYIYLTLTAVLALLLLGDMSLFDSVCHSFSTISTGGFSTKQTNIAYFNSPYIEYVISLFMILSGINFTLYFYLTKGKVKKALKDCELKWYMVGIVILTIVFSFALAATTPLNGEESFRKGLLHVTSILTTTGFTSADYMTWEPFLWAMLAVMMFIGASSGSATGAIKSIRFIILGKMTRNQFRRMIHPNAVLPVKINKIAVSPSLQSSAIVFVLVYITIFTIGWLGMMIMGVGNIEYFGTVASSLGNVGPGLGLCGPAYSWSSLPDGSKWLLSFLMLIGRLEIFSVLLLFTPYFWKKR